MNVEALDPLLSPEGWVYASSPPVEPSDPGRFHALFGRDSLITALQVLPARPDVARATLRSLAVLQGRADDADTDEEPGKILHEHRPQAPDRLIAGGWPVRDGALLYYGSADSTSRFLVVLAALDDAGLTAELEPAWRAAAGWLERSLSRGGGLVRYGPRDRPGGLAQQGWRDATAPVEEHPEGGGILRPDGSAPRAPQADADVQAAAYAALRALCTLSGEEAWARRAEALASRIERDFGPGVMALEADDLAVPGPGSQLGGFCGRALCRRRSAARSRTGSASPTSSRRSGCAPFRARARCSIHRAITAARSGRSTRGWAGAACAPPATDEDAERVRSGVLAALDRLGHAPELYAITAGGRARDCAGGQPRAGVDRRRALGARERLGGRPDWL